MRDHPLATSPPEPDGRPHPDVGVLPAGPRPTDPVEAVAEGHLVARRETQVADLVADRAPEREEPRRQTLAKCLGSLVSQRRGEVKREDVRCVVGHDPVDVLGVDRSHSVFDDPADLGLRRASAVSRHHFALPWSRRSGSGRGALPHGMVERGAPDRHAGSRRARPIAARLTRARGRHGPVAIERHVPESDPRRRGVALTLFCAGPHEPVATSVTVQAAGPRPAACPRPRATGRRLAGAPSAPRGDAPATRRG